MSNQFESLPVLDNTVKGDVGRQLDRARSVALSLCSAIQTLRRCQDSVWEISRGEALSVVGAETPCERTVEMARAIAHPLAMLDELYEKCVTSVEFLEADLATWGCDSH